MQRDHGAFILARYSTDNQNADTIEVQVGKCSEWCNAQGLPILGVYADYAVSGMKDTRPQYEAMMAALREGRADTVVIYDQSRMFRDLTLWFGFRKDLECMGVRVHSVTQPNIGGDLKKPSVFLEESVWAVFNQLHVLQTQEKTNAAKRHKANRGEHNGGIPPLGYRVEDKHLVIDESEASVVRRIFAEYAAGRSYKQIIDGLNRDGLKTKRGNRFGSNSLHDLLHNEKYTGVLIYGGKPYRSDGSRNTHGAASADAIRIADAVPAIIERELFDKVQERMAQNRRQQGGRPPKKRSYPLQGKVFCGHCKSAMSVSTSQKTYDYYKCTRKKQQKTSCENTPYRVDKLEELVAASIRSQLSSAAITDTLIATLRTEALRFQGIAVDRLKRLQSQELDISRKLNNAMDAILDGLTSPALKKRVAELESQQRSISRDIKVLRQQAEASDIPVARIRGLLTKCLAPENADALLSLVSRVEIYHDHIEIWYIWDPTPTDTVDYTTPGLPVSGDVTITNGTASGVPIVFVTPQFLRIVVAR